MQLPQRSFSIEASISKNLPLNIDLVDENAEYIRVGYLELGEIESQTCCYDSIPLEHEVRSSN